MQASVLRDAPRGRTGPSLSAAFVLRVALVVGCVGAVAIVAGLIAPSPLAHDDPALARLLRGMALIKSAIVVATMAVLVWRFGHPVDRRLAVGYVSGAVLIAAATATIWQLAFIIPAAILFHFGALMLLVVAWRDDGTPLSRFARGSPMRQRTIGRSP